MKVFISHSGDKSRNIAHALERWLPQVIQSLEPWVSSSIEKGISWRDEVTKALDKAKIGIICLTPENLSEPWILFEAGVLSRTEDAHVCTFLIGLNPTDVKDPLAQFQATSANREDVKKLIDTINKKFAVSGEKSLDQAILDKSFDRLWPELEAEIQEILHSEPAPQTPFRETRDVLEEILSKVRNIESNVERLHENVQTPGSLYKPVIGAQEIPLNVLTSNASSFREEFLRPLSTATTYKLVPVSSELTGKYDILKKPPKDERDREEIKE